MKAPNISQTPVVIRPATPDDLTAINAIYNYYVAHSTCVWTTQPCSEAERIAWYQEHGSSMPVLVAEHSGRVVGWGALGSFRAAYTAAGTLEDSIYVHHDFHRQRIGSQLLQSLIEAARQSGLRSILANISGTRRRAFDFTRHLDFRRSRICEMSAQRTIKDSMQSIYNCYWQPNKSPEPTAVGACRSAVAVHVASRRWLSFLR